MKIIKKICYTLVDFFSLKYLSYLRSNNNLIFSNIRVKGFPIIDIRNGGEIIIENNVLLNSRNFGYHINMANRVKLFCDKPNAKISIGENSRIHGSCIHAFNNIKIGRNCLIAANCQIFDASGHDLSFEDVDNRINTFVNSSPIVIEDSVWLGANSVILPGSKIGYGSVIGAGSVVKNEIPPMVIAAGNPVKIIKKYQNLRYYD